MPKIKVSVDRSRCIGSGNCVDIAQDVFSQDEDDGSVILLQEFPPEGLSEVVTKAVRRCPAMAIQVVEI